MSEPTNTAPVTTESLAQGLGAQQVRVTAILKAYAALPDHSGAIVATLIEYSLARAARAAAEGDVVAMAIAYTDLSGYEL